MSASAGLAVFNLGSGTKVFPTAAYTFTDVFSNSSPTLNCSSGGIYSPSVSGTDNRRIIAQFLDGSPSGWQTLPQINVNSVPYANYAGDSRRLSGFSGGLISGGAGSPGGGGGAINSSDGGGSSHAAASATSTLLTSGSGSAVANSADADYIAGKGNGAGHATGQPGLIVIYY